MSRAIPGTGKHAKARKGGASKKHRCRLGNGEGSYGPKAARIGKANREGRARRARGQ